MFSISNTLRAFSTEYLVNITTLSSVASIIALCWILNTSHRGNIWITTPVCVHHIISSIQLVGIQETDDTDVTQQRARHMWSPWKLHGADFLISSYSEENICRGWSIQKEVKQVHSHLQCCLFAFSNRDIDRASQRLWLRSNSTPVTLFHVRHWWPHPKFSGDCKAPMCVWFCQTGKIRQIDVNLVVILLLPDWLTATNWRWYLLYYERKQTGISENLATSFTLYTSQWHCQQTTVGITVQNLYPMFDLFR